MLLTRIAEKALVTAAPRARDAGISLDAAIVAVDLWDVTLFTYDIPTIETVVAPLGFFA
jgi:hypothetical protein